MRGLFTAFIALSASQLLSVAAQADPACLTNCGSQSRADFTKYSCANADDAACLCAAPDFKNSVRDCASACGGGEVDSFLSDGFCVGQAPAAPTEEAPEAPATTDAGEAQPETTAPAEEPQSTEAPAEEPTSTEGAEEQSSSEEASVEPPAQTEAEQPVATPATSSAQEEATTSAVAETTSSSASSTLSTAVVAKPTDDADDDKSKEDEDKDEGKKEDADSGLGKGAIIGIAVGASVVGLAALGLMLLLCLRRRGGDAKKDAHPFVEISKPMPMSGPGAYTGRTDPFAAEKGGNAMELQTNRYEDMLPRQVPRTVV